MLEIAICDDTPQDCQLVEGLVRNYFKYIGLPINTSVFQKPQALAASNQEYDIYFLDVMMPGMTGIEIARKIKKQRKKPVFIFITSSLESAVDGYSVSASGFILKPVKEENFNSTMERVMKEHFNDRQNKISAIHNRVPIELLPDKILYFENQLHRVFVVMENGERLAIQKKLTEWEQELISYKQFIRCHQSYLVNLDKVQKLLDNAYELVNQEQIPISRNFYKECKKEYYRYILR